MRSSTKTLMRQFPHILLLRITHDDDDEDTFLVAAVQVLLVDPSWTFPLHWAMVFLTNWVQQRIKWPWRLQQHGSDK